MTTTQTTLPMKRTDSFFIDGKWVSPSSSQTFAVIDATTEQTYFQVPEATAGDMTRAIAAARNAFDNGPWPQMSPSERAGYLHALADGLRTRAIDFGQVWPRQSGILHSISEYASYGAASTFDYYHGIADTFDFESIASPIDSGFGLLVREPVGVVGAIVAWNAPLFLLARKVAPALLAGCTVVIKLSPEAPAEGYLFAELTEAAGLPAGVINVVTADREVSELLVRDPRVDKITFTGSTAAGRRIASLCGERIARYTLELGGKSAAVLLEDADVASAAETLARAELFLSGQVCDSLTRVIVPRNKHDELVDAMAAIYSSVVVGDPFDSASQMGPLAVARQRDRVEGYINQGVQDGANLVVGGKRPTGLDRGWYIEPTLFSNVDNAGPLAQDEIFGPVLSVIPADNDEHAIQLANDSIYGLNAAVFTPDVDRARAAAAKIRSGTVGHNGPRIAFDVAIGGFKQSGIGREGGTEGLMPFLETKVVLLDSAPTGYTNPTEGEADTSDRARLQPHTPA